MESMLAGTHMRKKTPLVMKALYGKYSPKVVNRLKELDTDFAELTFDVAYDAIWSRKGLSLREKSLVTIAALVASGKEEQTAIHMRGFLKSGGTSKDLRNALIHLVVYCGFPAVMNALATLKKVESER